MTNPLPNADELEVVAWAYPQGEKLGVTTNRQTACGAFSGIANPIPLVTLSSAQAQIAELREALEQAQSNEERLLNAVNATDLSPEQKAFIADHLERSRPTTSTLSGGTSNG